MKRSALISLALTLSLSARAFPASGLLSFFKESPAKTLETEFVAVGEKVGPAVVTIITTAVWRDPETDEFLRYFFGVPGRSYAQEGLGSGVIIDPAGYILTNQHVIDNAQEILVRLPDGREFPASLTGADETYDLAVIKIEASDLPAAPLGDSDRVKIGQWAIAIGNPFGAVVDNPQPSLTVGVVSALERRIRSPRARAPECYEGLIQTDAAINPGNSGGPLTNLKGEVIGINTAIFSTSGGYQGVGFAIPINRAKAILEDLKNGREVVRGWLGVWVQPVTEAMRSSFASPDLQGALVHRVEAGSPAETAGIIPGDIIRSFNGAPVLAPSDLVGKIKYARAGMTAEIEVLRDGKIRKIEASLEPKEGLSASARESPAAARVSWRGLTLEDARMAEGGGVRIGRIARDSAAAALGLRSGDAIDEINRQPVATLREFQRVAEAVRGPALVHTSRGYLILPED
jgi:serine protease Do